MLTGTHVEVDRKDAVATLRLVRPKSANSLDVETARELRRAALGLARDEGVRVIVLAGVEGFFCTGADLKYVHAGGDPGELAYLAPATASGNGGYGAVLKEIVEYLHSTIAEIVRAPKPVVAAVDGVAAAGGFGLAMACDLVVASERARFEWAYARTGLCGAEGLTFLLPRLVGLRRAVELATLGSRLDARAAGALGLVTAVHPTADFAAEVERLCEQLQTLPRSWTVTKGLLHQAAGMDQLDRHLDQELEHLVRVADGEEFAEGLARFVSSRAPLVREP